MNRPLITKWILIKQSANERLSYPKLQIFGFKFETQELTLKASFKVLLHMSLSRAALAMRGTDQAINKDKSWKRCH